MFYLLALLAAGILLYLAAIAVIVIMENSVPAPRDECKAVLVLGAQIKPDGQPSVQLTYRMQAALTWQQNHPEAIIICCGGQGKDEPVAEGDRMREWFLEQGVDPGLVFSENESTDTKENIALAKRFLKNPDEPVVIVTSDYHVPRAVQVARDQGLDADGLPAKTLPSYWLRNHLREVLAWGKYFLKKIF